MLLSQIRVKPQKQFQLKKACILSGLLLVIQQHLTMVLDYFSEITF